MRPIPVVGLGTAVFDFVQLVDHFPAGEEVQRALDVAVQGGGPVATAMVTLARLGVRTAMIDAVGDDWRGQQILEEFEREDVCTDFMRFAEGCTSRLACVWVRKEDGARTIVYSPGDVPELVGSDLTRSVIQTAQFLHVNGRHWEACLEAIGWIKAAGGKVSFDGGAHRYRPEMKQLVPLVDVCIVARDFAERYTGETDIDTAAEMLLNEGSELVIITDGVRGSWLRSQDGQSFHQPAFQVGNVVDTTGCGDSYHGAAIFGLLKGMCLEEVTAFASAVAALNAQHLGGRQGLPTREQVQAFLAEQKER